MILVMIVFSLDIVFNLVQIFNAIIVWNTFKLALITVSIALHSYFLLVVFSLYKKLQSSDDQVQTGPTTSESAWWCSFQN